MCDNVWADVSCIRYVEHFADFTIKIPPLLCRGREAESVIADV